jgi:ubiquinone/menaquinone biosynthesis C-methylase UbiE
MSELERARKLYETQYKIDWHNRDYTWHPRNPNSLIHEHLMEDEIIAGLNALDVDLIGQTILDLGCGYGRMLRFWTEMGASPANMHGLDLSFYRLQRAHELSPAMGMAAGSAGALPYPSQKFHLVSQFSVFSSIHDAALRKAASEELMRVLKPGGWLIWYDIASSKGGNIVPLNKRQVLSLFPGSKLGYERQIFSTRLTRFIHRNKSLAIILEQLPVFRRVGLIMIFQKQVS